MGQSTHASFAESKHDAFPRQRRIEVTAASFTSVGDLLVGTDRLAVMRQRLAKGMAERTPIAWQALPFDFPATREMAQFNRTRENDRRLTWFIDQIEALALDGQEAGAVAGIQSKNQRFD